MLQDGILSTKGQPCNCPNCINSLTGKSDKHKCHIEGCGKEYNKTSHLRSHLGSHLDILPFACDWENCDKRFYRKDQLKRHEYTHSGEKHYDCFVCGSLFSRSDHLSKHMKKHTPNEIRNAAVDETTNDNYFDDEDIEMEVDPVDSLEHDYKIGMN